MFAKIPVRKSGSDGQTPLADLKRIARGNGVVNYFAVDGSNWTELYGVNVRLEPQASEQVFIDLDGNREIYDLSGKLVRIESREGWITQLTYDNDGLLQDVTGHSGRKFTFSYNSDNRIVSVVYPDGELKYQYDANGNLTSVTYPDGSIKSYLYEHEAFASALTGIVDENSNRYAKWDFNADGKVILSEHSGGIDRVTFTYNNDGSTTVTDVLGGQRTYTPIVVNGDLRLSSVTGDKCANCSVSNIQSVQYDANGNIASKTDWNGVTTTYTYDMARNLELTRTEAQGTPQERTITTEWHPDYRLPTKITEPGKITEYSYDAQGRQLTSKVSSVQ
jgi:YD repeat-containing protein